MREDTCQAVGFRIKKRNFRGENVGERKKMRRIAASFAHFRIQVAPVGFHHPAKSDPLQGQG